MADVLHLAQSISVHCWNSDRSRLAISPNNNEVHIYARAADGWNLEFVLKEHEESQYVSGIDWAPQTNRIVTCGSDRNAYVWNFMDGIWKPTLVILRLPRAATCVKWSHNEKKFAVASSAKTVAICYFEEANDWWVSKHIKNHESTITKLDWHPDNIMLATSSTDFSARVLCTAIKGFDAKPTSVYGGKLAFGEVWAEHITSTWVQSIRFSPSGNRLAFITYDSNIHFSDVPSTTYSTVRLNCLPLTDLTFVNENTVVGVGHDCNPVEFKCGPQGWAMSRMVDSGVVAKKAGGDSAMSIFRNKVETGQSSNITTLNTKHQNSVNCIKTLSQNEFSTSGLDGKVVLWRV
eukprot:TRINITY_DN1065_c0_g3_i1.p1 TRINITY_DN1065_c0_g3~~TRINITY_DN1065_c0_g3_i1.p1  ORF type:complete len:348 (-),score=180.76 TRINITY_DN1065_c0_g3_i1:79-1122(-)